MTETLLTVVAFACSLAGFCTLALTQKRHWHKILGAMPGTSLIKLTRATGSGLLLVSLLLSVFASGSGFGAVIWLYGLTLSAFAVTVAMTLWMDAVSTTLGQRREPHCIKQSPVLRD